MHINHSVCSLNFVGERPGDTSSIEKIYNEDVFDEILVGVGYKYFAFREEIYNILKKKVKFATLVHTTCKIDESCEIGEGSVLLPGSTLDHNVKIGENVLVNIDCSIAHNSIIKSHSFLSPRVAIAGFVQVGKRCNIGINSTIIDNVALSDDIQTGGGSVVINNLTIKGLYVGTPCRLVR